MNDNRGHRLRFVADLSRSDTYVGRKVTVGELTGTLTGVIPVAGRTVLALEVGGARVWTGWLDNDAAVEIWQRSAS